MAFFNKIAASILIVVYLLSATTTLELLKFPLLATHYYEHREENKNITLFTFLVSHYFVEDNSDKDAARDGKLPFKSNSHFDSGSFVSLTPPVLTNTFIKPTVITGEAFFLQDDSFIPSQYLAAIWQPPRN